MTNWIAIALMSIFCAQTVFADSEGGDSAARTQMRCRNKDGSVTFETSYGTQSPAYRFKVGGREVKQTRVTGLPGRIILNTDYTGNFGQNEEGIPTVTFNAPNFSVGIPNLIPLKNRLSTKLNERHPLFSDIELVSTSIQDAAVWFGDAGNIQYVSTEKNTSRPKRRACSMVQTAVHILNYRVQTAFLKEYSPTTKADKSYNLGSPETDQSDIQLLCEEEFSAQACG